MRSILPITLALSVCVTPAAALAGANKTWVSGTGADSGTCPITAPCKSFQYALGQTGAGGEIDVKDSGGYGVVTITKAIAIVAAQGILASISVPTSGTGVTVHAGANDVVILRGLTIDGHGVGLNGIYANSAAQLIVQDTVLQGMAGSGLLTDSFYGLPYVSVSNVIAQNNGVGVNIDADAATIYGSRFSHNSTGLMTYGNAEISKSIFEFNKIYGIDINGTGAISDSIFSFEPENVGNNSNSYGGNIFRSGYTGTLTTLTRQ